MASHSIQISEPPAARFLFADTRIARFPNRFIILTT